MKYSIYVFAVILFILACKKEERVYPPCSLTSIDSSLFTGTVSFCNAHPGLQQDFLARAFTVVHDSVIIFSITSLDSTLLWQYTDSAFYECVYPEGNESFKLFSLMDGSQTGYLMHGVSLDYSINKQPCTTSSHFQGWLE